MNALMQLDRSVGVELMNPICSYTGAPYFSSMASARLGMKLLGLGFI